MINKKAIEKKISEKLKEVRNTVNDKDLFDKSVGVINSYKTDYIIEFLGCNMSDDTQNDIYNELNSIYKGTEYYQEESLRDNNIYDTVKTVYYDTWFTELKKTLKEDLKKEDLDLLNEVVNSQDYLLDALECGDIISSITILDDGVSDIPYDMIREEIERRNN